MELFYFIWMVIADMSISFDAFNWKEQIFINKDLNFRNGKLVTCGIDIGSVSSKALILVDGQIFAYSIVRTSYNSEISAERAFGRLTEETGIGINDCRYIVSTGYGRVHVPFANKYFTEISCHGKGALYAGGHDVRTILDMGGQDCKVIKIDEEGRVQNFLMNDKCAAGTGKGIEMMAELLEVPIEEMGERSFDIIEEPQSISNVCVVYARFEAIRLLKKGFSKNMVIAAYLKAMAERTATLLMKASVEPQFFISGGISKNIGVVKRIENIIGISAIKSELDSQIIGALGASLLAKKIYEQKL